MTDPMANDPVCGMMVPAHDAPTTSFAAIVYHFCSDFCQREFLADPGKYAEATTAGSASREAAVRRIAYFSMEVAVDPRIPTYSGGLGVLAGDTLRSCADLKIPIVAVTLLYRRGYFDQRLDEWGNQQESPISWQPSDALRPLPPSVCLQIEGRFVFLQAWQHDIAGATGYKVPVLFLDTDLDQNAPEDRTLTASLYGGDERYRLAQEAILGVGGPRMLRALGYHHLTRFHMNEGHASLLTLELLREHGDQVVETGGFSTVREQCVFTTHTPVAAGHDQFSYDLVGSVVGEIVPFDAMRMLAGNDRLHMTRLALNMSHYVNGVAKRHGEVSQAMFPGYAIDAITNGVHSLTWTCESFRALFDRYIPGWANDPLSLRHAISIPKEEIWVAHLAAKARLLEEVKQRTGASLSLEALTIGFARRAAAYKRADLVFADVDRLVAIARTAGPIQFVYAGKAHPRDEPGKGLIRRIFEIGRRLKSEIPVVYLENYDMDLAKLVTAGVDVWLNTPQPPQEASGTSGMKAAHNGVPSLSVLDGWWIEGHIDGDTGWAIGPSPAQRAGHGESDASDAADLYRKLGDVIVPLFYGDRGQWKEIMRYCIAINASFFNTHRMVQQYAVNAYL